jgi:hypothetical protein
MNDEMIDGRSGDWRDRRSGDLRDRRSDARGYREVQEGSEWTPSIRGMVAFSALNLNLFTFTS